MGREEAEVAEGGGGLGMGWCDDDGGEEEGGCVDQIGGDGAGAGGQDERRGGDTKQSPCRVAELAYERRGEEEVEAGSISDEADEDARLRMAMVRMTRAVLRYLFGWSLVVGLRGVERS